MYEKYVLFKKDFGGHKSLIPLFGFRSIMTPLFHSMRPSRRSADPAMRTRLTENISYLDSFSPPTNKVWDKVIFSEACVKNSVHRGGSASVHARIPPCQGGPPAKETPRPRDPPAKETPPARETPLPRRPLCQAHTQGGNYGGTGQGPHPRGKLRGIRSRSTPKG